MPSAQQLLSEYEEYLLRQGLSPLSIERKLSSVRAYLTFVQPKEKRVSGVRPSIVDYEERLRALGIKVKETKNSVLSQLLLVRLAKKAVKAVKSLSSCRYAIPYALKYRRPAWLIRYQKLPASRYLNWGMVILLCVALGIGGYEQFNHLTAKRKGQVLGAPTNVPSYLSFQGLLTDSSGNPITTKAHFRFSIYNSATASGSAKLYEEAKWVEPDENGVFNTLIGDTYGLDKTIFRDNTDLFLGVTVNQNEEMTPRQRIATVAYAFNSQYLQGFGVNTTGAGVNEIPVVNSDGNVIIAAASPSLRSTSGVFKLDAKTMYLTTAENGNIHLDPNGTGTINLTSDTLTGNAINATASALTTGTLFYGAVQNSNTDYDLLRLRSGSTLTDKFTVDASGNTNIAGNLDVGGTGTVDSLKITGTLIDSGNNPGIAGLVLTSTGTGVSWGEAAGTGGDADTLDTLDSTQFLRSDTADSFTSGTLIFDAGTTLDIDGNLAIADTDITLNGTSTNLTTTGNFSINGSQFFLNQSSGNVGIGLTSPTQKLDINGNINVGGTGFFNSVKPGILLDKDSQPGSNQYVLISTGTGINWVDIATVGVGGTGTANYISKWTPDGHHLGDSLLYDNGTSLGIGTTSPTAGYLFDVNGNLKVGNTAYIAGNLNVGNTANFSYLTASRPLKTDASKNIISALIDITSPNDITGILPVTYGGTGIGTTPAAGQLLIGKTDGSYNLTNLTAGTGMTIANTSGSITINHTDTSSQVSSNNSNGVVVQDITLDDLGHLTALETTDLDNRYIKLTDTLWFLGGDSGTPQAIGLGNTAMIAGGNGLTSVVSATDTLTLAVGAGNGISVAADSVAVDQTYNFSWTGTHSWTNTATFTGNVYLGGAGNGIWSSSGNVGVGTTNPTQKLDVNGNLNVGGTGFFTSIKVGILLDGNNSPGSAGLILKSTGTGVTWSSVSDLSVGNADTLDTLDSLDFLRSTASDTFEAGNTLTIAGNLIINDADIGLGGTSANFTTTGNFSINGSQFFLGQSGGNVGIGTTTIDSYKLNVNGQANMSGLCLNGNCKTSWADIGIGGSGTMNYISKWTPDGDHLGNSLIYDNGAALGVGTTSPTAGYLFDINGNLKVGNTAYIAGNLNVGDTANLSYLTASLPVKTDADKNLVSGLINLINDITGTLGIANGGTNNTTFDSGKFVAYDGSKLASTVYDQSSFEVPLTFSNGLTRADNNDVHLGGTLEGATAINQAGYDFGFQGGNVGVGTTAPTAGYVLDVAGNLRVGGTAYFAQNVGIGTTNPTAKLTVQGTVNFNPDGSSTGFYYNPTDNAVGLGTSSPHNIGGSTSRLVIADDDGNNSDFTMRVGGSSYGAMNFKTSGGTVASSTISINGDYTGMISFYGYTGSNFRKTAKIVSSVDGGPGLDDMPGDLEFFTTPDGSGTEALRMVINNQGNVGIGTSSPVNRLDVSGNMAIGSYAGTYSAPANSLIVSGNVGIGITSPLAKLHLQDSDVGIYLTDTGDLTWGLSTLGTGASRRFSIKDVTGNSELLTVMQTGNVGIGTTDPQAKLTIGGATSTISNDSGDITIDAASNNISFNGDNLINVADFSTTGNIGIGTTPSDTYALYVDGDVYIAGSTTIVHDLRLNGNQILNADGTGAILFSSTPTATWNTLDSGAWLITNTANLTQAALLIDQQMNGDIFTASSSGTHRFVIKNDGNVGIGTTDPDSKLHILGSDDASSRIKIERTGATPGTNILGYNYLGTFSNEVLRIFTNSTEKLRVNTAGNVGIGTTNPGALLSLAGGGLQIGGVATDPLSDSGIWTKTNFGLILRSSTVEAMGLKYDGNVGIGTTDPGAKLQIFDETTPELRLSNAGSSSYETMGLLSFYETTGIADPVAQIKSIRGASYYNQGDLRFYTNPGHASNPGTILERMRIESDGNVGIGTTDPAAIFHSAKDVTWNTTTSVSGQAYLGGVSDQTKRLVLGFDTTSNFGFIQATQPGINFRNLFLNPGGGNVGIGSTGAPNELLDVAGTAEATMFQGGNIIIVIVPDGGCGSNGAYADCSNGYQKVFDANGETIRYRVWMGGNNSYAGNLGSRIRNVTDNVTYCTVTGTGTAYAWYTTTCALASGSKTYNIQASKVYIGDETNYTYIGTAYVMFNGGADVAEIIPSDDKTIKAGELVSIDTNNGERVVRTTKAYDSNVIGVVSTDPGVTLGNTDSSSGPQVGLAGRVPTRVSTINGPIHKGDPITSSSIPGVGMKATKSGMVVGRAMGDWTDPNSNNIGSVIVFLQNGHQEKNLMVEKEDGSAYVYNPKTGEPTLTIDPTGQVEAIKSLSSPEVKTNVLSVKEGNNLKLNLGDNQSFLVTNNGSTTAEITAQGEVFANNFGLLAKANDSFGRGDLIAVDDNGQASLATKGDKPLGVNKRMVQLTMTERTDLQSLNTEILTAGPTQVKVAGPVKAGDLLSVSSLPGYAAKNTQAGYVIGKASQSFNPDPSTCPLVNSAQEVAWPETANASTCFRLPDGTLLGKVPVFLDIAWYDPDTFLTDIGDLKITNATGGANLLLNAPVQLAGSGEDLKLVEASTGRTIDRLLAGAAGVFAQVRSGLIQTTNLIADRITINQTLVAPLVETGELTADGAKVTKLSTDFIAPASEDVVISLAQPTPIIDNDTPSSNDFGRLLVKGVNDEVVLSVEANGEAQFSGNVGIGQTLEAKDASISGELYAESARIKKLRAESIEGLEELFATMSAQYIGSINNTYNNSNNVSGLEEEIASTSSDLNLTDSMIATDSGELEGMASNWPVTNPSDDVKIESNVSILGVTTLAQTIVSGPLTQDGTLIVDNGDSINVLGGTLYLQNQGSGGIDLLAGKVTIDTLGNAVFEGNLTVKSTLFANLVKPLDGGDLTIDLSYSATDSSEPASVGFGRLLAKGVDGETVFSLDASGSAELKGELAAAAFKITREAVAAEPNSSGVIEATASAGLARILAGSREVTIKSPYINEKSLIYLTPVGSTSNQVLYLARTNPDKQTFTAAIDRILTKDILFSWWIVN